MADTGLMRNFSFSQRVYGLLLAAYPAEFRRRYGREMMQVFRDCCRAEAGRHGAMGLARLWTRTLVDLIYTALGERMERFRKGVEPMRILRTIALAILAYAAVFLLVIPFYLRIKGSVPGFVVSLFDAMISTGLIFNFIVLVLFVPRLLSAARAVYAAGLVTLLLMSLLLVVMSFSMQPEHRPGLSILITQVISYLFWFGVHLVWARWKEAVPTTAAESHSA